MKENEEVDLSSFEIVNWEDESVVDKIVKTIDSILEPYRVKIEDQGLDVADYSQKCVTKQKNKIAKFFKCKRDFYNKMSKQIINIEKKVNSPCIDLEEELKEAIRGERHRIEVGLRRQTLPFKRELAFSKGFQDIDDDFILSMTDLAFAGWLEEEDERIKGAVEAREKQRQLLQEAEEQGRKKHEEAERQKELEAKEKVLEDERIARWLESNDYSSDGSYKIIVEGQKVFLWKLVDFLYTKED